MLKNVSNAILFAAIFRLFLLFATVEPNPAIGSVFSQNYNFNVSFFIRMSDMVTASVTV